MHGGSVTPETECRLQHGVKHEINAVATLIGRFLPAFYPEAIFIEEGCYIIPGVASDILGVVSSDGSIRSSLPKHDNSEQNVIAAIEIKCPLPSDKQTSVHYSLPEYYVCQCLDEMVVLKTDQLLYVSYSETYTTVLKVSFSADLWTMIWNEIIDLYDKDTVTKPTKSRLQTKEIKDRIKDVVRTNVQLLCEIPSCKMSTESDLTAENDNFFKGANESKTWYMMMSSFIQQILKVS